MKNFFKKQMESLQELTTVRNLVLCGLMAALSVVLNMVASISFGPYVKIGFSGLPHRIVEYLFGPMTGCIFGAVLDILKYVIKPDGPFYFGFTFNAMVAGFIYGNILYKKNITIPRVLCAEFLVKLIVNCFLNTLFIAIIYGKGFFVLLPLRVIKNIIMLPIDTAILFFVLTSTKKIVSSLGFFANNDRISHSADLS